MKAKMPTKNFCVDHWFFKRLNDFLMSQLDMDNLCEIQYLSDEWSCEFQLTSKKPVFQLTFKELKEWLSRKCGYDRWPKDLGNEIIDEALKQSIDIDKLNALIPKLWYPNGKFVTVTKQDLIDHFKQDNLGAEFLEGEID